MDTRLLTEVATVIRDGSTEDRQALLVTVASALAICGGPAPDVPGAAGSASASDDRLLTMPEVAVQLGIPTDRAYDLGRQGRLPVETMQMGRPISRSLRSLTGT